MTATNPNLRFPDEEDFKRVEYILLNDERLKHYADAFVYGFSRLMTHTQAEYGEVVSDQIIRCCFMHAALEQDHLKQEGINGG